MSVQHTSLAATGKENVRKVRSQQGTDVCFVDRKEPSPSEGPPTPFCCWLFTVKDAASLRADRRAGSSLGSRSTGVINRFVTGNGGGGGAGVVPRGHSAALAQLFMKGETSLRKS